MRRAAYARAGVDIPLGNRVKSGLPGLLASTRRPGVLGQIGGFGGLFALDPRRYRRPVLVSSVDGVGTKLKVAFAVGRHDTIGQDLVNHCVNDIVVLGAEPLFFLDYLGTGKLKPAVFEKIIQGFVRGCVENHCALIGGETAQMPGFYAPGEYDVSGAIVGAVERDRILNGRAIAPGDTVLGIASNGLHTNGYSLARRILFEQMKLKPGSRVPEFGCTVAEELLKVHRSYGPLVLDLIRRFNPPRGRPVVKGFAHITGGGFFDNIPRILPGGCDAAIRRGAWDPLPIFEVLQRAGKIAEAEMFQVFNMGIGMMAVVNSSRAPEVVGRIRRKGHRAWLVGEIRTGEGRVQII
jgi:phosphoribosylformylglycinamidine cyclo-ligase